jgi:plasmid stabilization system protein ParE
MSGYAFHPDAFADLDEIWEYIAKDNLDAADRILADIHTVLRTLATSPHIGHRRPDLTARPMRFHVVRDDFLIAYAPDENPLWVVAVLHGRRNPTHELSPGPHRLRVSNTLVWKTVAFDAKPGEAVRFPAINRPGKLTYPMLLIIGVGPLYVTVRRLP